jgi:hypothetical protein
MGMVKRRAFSALGCRSNSAQQRSQEQNHVGDQEKRETADAVKLWDVAINCEQRQHGEQN